MNLKMWWKNVSLEKKDLYHKLYIVFGLFFLVPVFGFFYFALKYNILEDKYIPTYFIILLAFSLIGFTIIRKLFDQIRDISKDISDTVTNEVSGPQKPYATNELEVIAQSIESLKNELGVTVKNLGKKFVEIATLKELSDLCYVTLDTEELFYITLERALKIVNADIGSVLILERPHRKAFVVQVCIGLEGIIENGDRIDFATSIAKYAVINKSPLVVEDIEKDSRFGRKSHLHYGTKSFVCMPLKTINDIVGVLTISRKSVDIPFTQEDVEVLIPLLSNATFTYDNLRLLQENKRVKHRLRSMEEIVKAINSSLRDSELLSAILYEIQKYVAYDLAVILTWDENAPARVSILDFLALVPTNLSKGTHYPHLGSIIDKALKQEVSMIVGDMTTLSHQVEKGLFADQGFQSCLLTPLKLEGHVIGLLVLCSSQPKEFYAAQELIDKIADGLSLAIERNRLSTSVVKRKQELDKLKQIGSALASSTFDISQVLNYTMDMIRTMMDAEAGSLLLLDDKELEFKTSFNIDFESLRKHRLKLGQGIAGYVASGGEAVIVNDVKESRHFYPEVDKYTGFKTRSVLCVPMISQGNVIGVIEVLNKINGDFNANDEQLLQSIATSVSIALENARLYKETLSRAEHEQGIRHMFQKFVPKEIVDKIILGKDTETAVIEELKSLTLLNIDIRNFSTLTKMIGPQKTVSTLNYFFSHMGNIVFKHQGIVDKYLGDGFLAIFGAPISSAQHADNAITAALDMKQSMVAINDHIFKQIGERVCIGISVHTGEVVVGNIGFDRKMDYTVIGDSVNVVFRLQDLTKTFPNSILITETTSRASRSKLDLKEIGTYDIGYTLGELKVYELSGQQSF